MLKNENVAAVAYLETVSEGRTAEGRIAFFGRVQMMKKKLNL